MIDLKDVMPISFLKKEPFTGSFQGMRYRIEKQEADNEPTVLKTTIWPQPFCFDKTPDEKKSEKMCIRDRQDPVNLHKLNYYIKTDERTS